MHVYSFMQLSDQPIMWQQCDVYSLTKGTLPLCTIVVLRKESQNVNRSESSREHLWDVVERQIRKQKDRLKNLLRLK